MRQKVIESAMGRPARTIADRQQMAEIGKRLRWLREALGKSQAEMAERANVHQTAWSLYERGKRMPDQFEIPRLVGRLGISVDYLLEESLEGVLPEVAISLAARHPELVPPVGKPRRTGTGRA